VTERQDRRIEETKERLKAAMVGLLSESALPNVTVVELCDRADVAKKTFYNHYQDLGQLKTELLILYVMSVDLANADNADAKGKTVEEKFTLFMEFNKRVVIPGNGFLEWNLIHHGFVTYYQLTPESAALMIDMQNQNRGKLFQDEVSRGDFRKAFPLDVLVEFAMSMEAALTMEQLLEFSSAKSKADIETLNSNRMRWNVLYEKIWISFFQRSRAPE